MRTAVRLLPAEIALVLLTSVCGAFPSTGNHAAGIQAGHGITDAAPRANSFFISFTPPLLVSEYVTVNYEGTATFFLHRGTTDFMAGAGLAFRFGIPDQPLFLETGCGVNITSLRLEGDRHLGKWLLFSPTVGLGVRLPFTGYGLTVAYHFRHFSNAGFWIDNDGVNFQYIVFSVYPR